jgi:hypothetical protein
MSVELADAAIARVAGAIAEPSRARIQPSLAGDEENGTPYPQQRRATYEALMKITPTKDAFAIDTKGHSKHQLQRCIDVLDNSF